jgi:ribosome-binding factor A
MKERRRPLQVGDAVRAEVARLVREELSDPDIGFATITGVQMSPDLRLARVFVSVLGTEAQFAKSVDALNKAAHHLRGTVGRNCRLRSAPELRFVADHSIERGARIEQILRHLPPTPPEASPPDGEPSPEVDPGLEEKK